MLRQFISSYFGFNRRQRSGLLVLCIICFLLLIVRLAYPYFIPYDKISINDLPLATDSLNEIAVKIDTGRSAVPELFPFDPNKVTKDELQRLGFTERTANTYLNFRKKGFVFRKKEDLKKVYGITEKKYSELEPFIRLAVKEATALQPEKSVPVKTAANFVDINLADSAQLVTLNGVGPSFARRIIKYRELLGGYVSISQLKEVFGFTGEMFEKISPNVKISGAVKKIHLNNDDFKAVNRHPYISYEHTKAIFDQRRAMPITEAVMKEIVKDEVLFEKIRPYIEY